MTERDQVVEILRKAISPPFKAVMGRGDGVVNVTGRPGYVWCRKLGKTEMLMEAYNRGAPAIEDVIVLVQESRIEGVKGYEVIGVASSTSPGNYYPEVPPHAWTHEWRPGIGRDRVTVYPRAWGYLRAEPIATGSMNVWVTPGWYYYNDFLRWYVGGYSPGFYPPPSGTWNQLLSFEPSDESLHISNGSIVGYGLRANIPTPSGCTYPIAAIESTGTFSTINENMIEDVRLFMDPIEDCAETGTFAVHSHAADDGGQLDWDIIWSDNIHDHSAAGEGGQFSHANLTNLVAPADDHTQYFLADCTRAFGGDPIPDGADTRSLGSVDAEWLNIYVGEAGRIYFRLNQSVDLYSSAAGVLKTNDMFEALRVRTNNGLVGSPAYAFQSDIDTGMYRIGVNTLGFTTNSTLALKLTSAQQTHITNGTYLAPSLAFISDSDTGLYRVGANRLGFATNGTAAFEIDATQHLLPALADTHNIGGTSNEILNLYIGDAGKIYLGLAQDVNLYRGATNVLRTDDAFVAAAVAIDPDDYTNAIISGYILDGGGWGAFGVAFGSGAGGKGAIGAVAGVMYIGLQDGTNPNSMATVMQLDGSTGNVFPGGNKTQDFGLPATAWDDAYADDWHNVADLYLLDRLDDLAVICGIQPSGEVDPRTGLPLIDDKSLPEWVFTKDKKGKEVLYDPDGRPYLSVKMLSSLSFGAIRQLKEWVERLETQIRP